MNNMSVTLKKYIFLFAIFLIMYFSVCAYLSLKGNSKKKKNYYLRGMLLNLETKDILSLSLIIVNTIVFMFYLLLKYKIDLTLIVSSCLLLLGNIVLQRNINSIINFGINIVNFLVIYLNTYIISLGSQIPSRALYIAVQSAVNVFGILFYIFTFLKFIKDVCFNKEKLNEK